MTLGRRDHGAIECKHSHNAPGQDRPMPFASSRRLSQFPVLALQSLVAIPVVILAGGRNAAGICEYSTFGQLS